MMTDMQTNIRGCCSSNSDAFPAIVLGVLFLTNPEAETVITGRSNSRTRRRGSGYMRRKEKEQFKRKI
jgi:hypothetical protein